MIPACTEKMNAGDFAGANAVLLATFPEATRTPAESFILGNVLFDTDRRLSHELHQSAVKAEPENPDVVWEWALEQHRAGDYAGALASYQKVSAGNPRAATLYALEADCLLRLNRIEDAVAAWKKSEDAPDGSIESMEDLVCAVHREVAPHKLRADLLAKAVVRHDIAAAEDLIALDGDFPKDWWNGGPQQAYLAHDGPAVVAALNLPSDNLRYRSIECAVECLSGERDAPAIRQSLEKHRLLIDADHTVPPHGGLLSVMLNAAVEAKVIDDATLQQQIAPKVLALAKTGADAQLWNVAAYSASSERPAQMLGLERDAWKATNDARFAAGVLYLKWGSHQLQGDDADLAAALRQFPENGMVQCAALMVASRDTEGDPSIAGQRRRAEFTHFTSFVAPATVVNRPRSDYLRHYFAQLQSMPPSTQPAK